MGFIYKGNDPLGCMQFEMDVGPVSKLGLLNDMPDDWDWHVYTDVYKIDDWLKKKNDMPETFNQNK